MIDTLLLSVQLGLPHNLLAVCDDMSLLLVEILHVGLELAGHVSHRFIQVVPEVVEFGEQFQLFGVFILLQNSVEHAVSAIDLSVNESLVYNLLDCILLIGLLLLVNIVESFAVFLRSQFPLLVVNQLIVEVLKSLDGLDGVELVVLLVLAGEGPRVVRHLQHLQLVLQPLQVAHRLVQVAHQVLPEREHVQLRQHLQPRQLLDAVREDRQVRELRERVQVLDALDEVEAEVEPTQVDQVLEAVDLADDVVVELQLGEAVHALQVVDLDDVLVAELQVRELPERHVVLVEDVVLAVVLDEVPLDQHVVDHRRLHRLPVFLRLGLGL
mmetsp:Transcript_17135/g.26490  ORF Transcript_17135/g.26490 Transcript_17135/m.26490 type:complete len:326 (-) Transcript_17135:17-994(-)